MITKQNYQQQLQARLEQWQVEIDQLKHHADHAPDFDSKAEYNGQIEVIHALQQEAIKKLDKLGFMNEMGWDHLKEEMDKLWDSIEATVKDLKSRLGL